MRHCNLEHRVKWGVICRLGGFRLVWLRVIGSDSIAIYLSSSNCFLLWHVGIHQYIYHVRFMGRWKFVDDDVIEFMLMIYIAFESIQQLVNAPLMQSPNHRSVDLTSSTPYWETKLSYSSTLSEKRNRFYWLINGVLNTLRFTYWNNEYIRQWWFEFNPWLILLPIDTG